MGGARPDKERSASPREDPIHLGAATRQCEGAIRRAERRGQWAKAWKPRSGPALAETGRLNASERPSKVRNVKQRLVAWTKRYACDMKSHERCDQVDSRQC